MLSYPLFLVGHGHPSLSSKSRSGPLLLASAQSAGVSEGVFDPRTQTSYFLGFWTEILAHQKLFSYFIFQSIGVMIQRPVLSATLVTRYLYLDRGHSLQKWELFLFFLIVAMNDDRWPISTRAYSLADSSCFWFLFSFKTSLYPEEHNPS